MQQKMDNGAGNDFSAMKPVFKFFKWKDNKF